MSMLQQAAGSQACFHSSRMACGLTVCIWQQPVIVSEFQHRTGYTPYFTPWTVGACKAMVAIHLCQDLSPFLYKHRSGQRSEGQISCVPLLLLCPSWLLFKSETLTLVCPSVLVVQGQPFALVRESPRMACRLDCGLSFSVALWSQLSVGCYVDKHGKGVSSVVGGGAAGPFLTVHHLLRAPSHGGWVGAVTSTWAQLCSAIHWQCDLGQLTLPQFTQL